MFYILERGSLVKVTRRTFGILGLPKIERDHEGTVNLGQCLRGQGAAQPRQPRLGECAHLLGKRNRIHIQSAIGSL